MGRSRCRAIGARETRMESMTRKFFILEPGEEFLGVIRPSMWSLTPRILASLVLIGFPFFLWSSLMSRGIFFGGILAALSFIAGMVSLRDIRRHYLENGVYVTSVRLIDVHAKRRSFRAVELPWASVVGVDAPRGGVRGLFGYGMIHVRGNEDIGFSLVITPVWKPEMVRDALPRV